MLSLTTCPLESLFAITIETVLHVLTDDGPKMCSEGSRIVIFGVFLVRVQ